MSRKLFGSALSMSMGILSSLGDFPSDRFLRHILYIIILKDDSNGVGQVVESCGFKTPLCILLNFCLVRFYIF